MDENQLNRIASLVLDSAFRVHKVLGPGLLESVYKACLAIEVRNAQLLVEMEVPVPVVYAGTKVADVGYRMDLLVEQELIVEVKAVDAIHPVHQAQLLSYLRLSNRRLGLLINFNTVLLKDGIKRMVNRL